MLSSKVKCEPRAWKQWTRRRAPERARRVPAKKAGVGSEVNDVGRPCRRERERVGGQYPLSAKRVQLSKRAQDHTRSYNGGGQGVRV